MRQARGHQAGAGDLALQPDRIAILMNGINKAFDTVAANIDVSLELPVGGIHALTGENGAGKSTLMHILAGILVPDSGTVRVFGHNATDWDSETAIRAGIGMVHQHFMLIPALTAAENIIAGREPTRGAMIDMDSTVAAIAELSEVTGLAVDPYAVVSEMTVGEAQRVEILKALYRGARILILDEPTAVLTPGEIDGLWQVLCTFRDKGNTVVLITHKLDEVFAVTDTVTVMRGGRTVSHSATSSTTPDEVASEMMGREAVAPVKHQSQTFADNFAMSLRVEGLTVLNDRGTVAVNNLTFGIGPGEILGIAGVEGNGQQELIEAIVGGRRITDGRISLREHALTDMSIEERSRAGLAHIPSNRQSRGLIAEYTVAENLILGQQRQYRGITGTLDRDRIAREAAALIRSFDIRPTAQGAELRTLSGGNQQKVIIAREMGREFHVLVASHPTRGVDLGAVEFIHAEILEARRAGRAILLVSTDLSEILSLSDRIAVMYRGAFVMERDAHGCDIETLGLYMTGAAH